MEIDLAQLDDSAAGSDLLCAGVCVVGGGIAGLTLATELIGLGHEVVLLERGAPGGDEPLLVSEVIQAGHPHAGTIEAKTSAFGGSSLVWGGQLLPLPSDAGWPVTQEELAPYTLQAERLLGVDELPFDPRGFFKELRESMPDPLMKLVDLTAWLSKFVPFSHRNLARTLGQRLRRHSKARVVFNARVDEILLAPSRDRIEAVICRNPTGRVFSVKAKQFVIAAGTIETARLLLASNSVAEEGIGNGDGQVGRNFHDHLTITAATLRGSARRLFLGLRPWINHGTLHALKLSPSAELRGRLELDPTLAHLTIEEPEESGVGAIRSVLRARQQGGPQSKGVPLSELPRAVLDGARLAASAGLKHRRYVSERAVMQLRLNVAQQSPSDSRITLSGDGKPILDWRISESELLTLRKFSNHLREQFTIDGIDWSESLLDCDSRAVPPELDDARHAMGGACMGVDPHSSVVDPNLQVHGVNNCFIASAAVFPNGSPQLPTLPLMALTLRLANHLHGRI